MASGRHAQVIEAVRRWVREEVVGLRLCPFAAPVEDALAVTVSDAGDVDDAVDACLEAAMGLLASPEVPTTLVAFAGGLGDLDALLDVADAVEAALEASGAGDLLQVASFHPDYRFDGAAADDLGNYTNRSPVPIVHLLRAADVSEAIDAHPDPEGIPAANVARLVALGREAVLARWARHRLDP